MDLDVVFIGTAGAAPSARRGLPSTLIRRGGDRLLFDCGEGTQRQLLGSVGLIDVEHLFLTHYHADHVLGIPGMLKSFALRDRDAAITIYGPSGLNALFRVFDPLIGRLPYELTLRELEPNEELRFDDYRIAAFEVDHRVRAYGYALIEDWRPGRFDEQKAIELRAPTSAASRRARPSATSSPNRCSARRAAAARSSCRATPARAR
jgi:ribonuclease Z